MRLQQSHWQSASLRRQQLFDSLVGLFHDEGELLVCWTIITLPPKRLCCNSVRGVSHLYKLDFCLCCLTFMEFEEPACLQRHVWGELKEIRVTTAGKVCLKRRRISWFKTSKSVGFRCIVTMTTPHFFFFFLGFSSLLPLACGQRAEKRSRVSYIVDLYLLKRSKVPSGPPSPILTSHTIPRSTALSIWGASGLLWQHMVIHSRCLQTTVNISPMNNKVN